MEGVKFHKPLLERRHEQLRPPTPHQRKSEGGTERSDWQAYARFAAWTSIKMVGQKILHSTTIRILTREMITE